MAKSVHDFSAKSITGEDVSLSSYSGKALLIVNVASGCGLTPQYEGLEPLQNELGPQGFDVLGFPCNQFGAQEPGTEGEIATFCETSFGVTFPMFSKVEVNGEGTAPLYAHLKAEAKEASGKDDIEFLYEGIQSGFAFMQDNPHIGIGCFNQNRYNDEYTVADTTDESITTIVMNWHTTGLDLSEIVVGTHNTFKGVGSFFSPDYQLLIACVSNLKKHLRKKVQYLLGITELSFEKLTVITLKVLDHISDSDDI